MTERSGVAVALERVWADELPEMSVPARAVAPPAPELVVLNEGVAASLGLDAAWLSSPDGVQLLTGASAEGAVSQVYAGHQWGRYRSILGDGRAALLGELRDADGRLRDLHLKGIGPTPMSRVDGFATLGPMLREFLLGEAMHALGVPTTRALAVVSTGATRVRDGRGSPGAVLARTASSHVRIGTFEYAARHDDSGLLRRVADHVISRHHPGAASAPQPYRALLAAIVDATAATAAHWMRLGFVHGVLSTDNVLVSAETIDYGPCAFLDAYDPDTVYSSRDTSGRYAYARQPEIMAWNLERLGEALAPLLDDQPARGGAAAREIVGAFDERYRAHRTAFFRDKLGLDARVSTADVDELTADAHLLLHDHGVDVTGFWRDLATAADGDERPVRARFLGLVGGLDDWLGRWRRLTPAAERLRAANPVYIPRNHLVDEALDAAVAGDLDPFRVLLSLARAPYTVRSEPAYRRYAAPAPADHPPHRTFCGT